MAYIQDITSALMARVNAKLGLQISHQPLAHSATGGQYRSATRTGTVAAVLANNAVIWTMRNPNADPMVLLEMKVRFRPMAIFTTAAGGIDVTVGAFISRGFTVQGTTNGTSSTLTGDNQKMQQAGMAASGIGIVTLTTSNAGITADTATDDAQAFEMDSCCPQTHDATAAAAPGQAVQDYHPLVFNYAPVNPYIHPIVCAQNEGIRLRNLTVWPAAGTGIFIITAQFGRHTSFPLGA